MLWYLVALPVIASEAWQSRAALADALDCRLAPLLAMTSLLPEDEAVVSPSFLKEGLGWFLSSKNGPLISNSSSTGIGHVRYASDACASPPPQPLL